MTQESAINQLSDRLNELSARLKSREHSATVLEGVCAQMFGALFGWKLVNLNQEQGNFPGVDLGDETHRIAIQITVQDQSEKATHTIAKIESEKLRDRFECFLCFFLVPKAPGSRTSDPADFHRWGIRDLIGGILKPLHVPAWLQPHVPATHHKITLERLREALRILDETLGSMPPSGPKPNNLPFGRNSHFGQRQDEMTKLESALAHEGGVAALTQPQVVHGLGGVGKTQLAIQYAWQHAESFSALLWLPADSESSIVTGLARLCELLDLPEKEAREDSVRAEAVRRWLRMRSGWLLIADNVDTPGAQSALLREMRHSHHGRVIITSRLEDWSLHSAPILLSTWTDMQGAQWLQTRLDGKLIVCPETDAAALSRELGGLPLALEQAAAYMVQRRIGPAEYLRRFFASAEAAQKLLATAMPHGGGTGYEATVATTWLVTLDQLTPVARAILKMIAWLGPDEIPRFLFTRAPEAVMEAAAEAFGSELPSASEAPASEEFTEAVEEALALLARYSLIELREDHLTCHRLVQATQRWVEPQAWLLNTIFWVNMAIPDDIPPQDVRSWPLFWRPLQRPLLSLVAHEAAFSPPLPKEQSNLVGCSRLLNQLGLFLHGKADYQKAEQLYRRAFEIDEIGNEKVDPSVAIRLNNLASLLLETNRMVEAEPLFRRALEIAEASYGKNHPRVAVGLNNLAQLLKTTNRMTEAEPLMRRALEIDEASYGKDHPSVATRLNNLAQLLKTTNRLAEAEPMMRRAVKIDEACYRKDHPSVAIHLNNLASLLQATNQFAEAERLMRRAMEIAQASYGEDHPDVALIFSSLASLLRETNRLAEAELLMRRVLAINEAIYAPEHSKIAADFNNLAQLLKDANRLAEAEPLIRRAVGILVRGSWLDHPSTRTVLQNYRDLLTAQNLPLDEIEKRIQEVLAEAGKK